MTAEMTAVAAGGATRIESAPFGPM